MNGPPTDGTPIDGHGPAIRPATRADIPAIAELVARAEPWRTLPMTAADIELAVTQVVAGGLDLQLVVPGERPGALEAHGWLQDDPQTRSLMGGRAADFAGSGRDEYPSSP